ncbi:hypothetical protein PR048_015455 [Dryococelus australis]|uniref:Uncharacterized protein n=1 Tax=Dryococelus australis TaxID=614101 RepID=A0ABQ9HHJ2_9NEOP|nr:hypothetical protein PR048_015455 [Dryococelus australis]
MSGRETDEPQSKKQKGIINTNNWKRNIMTQNKVKGLAHTSYSGKQVAAEKTEDDCKCRLYVYCHVFILYTLRTHKTPVELNGPASDGSGDDELPLNSNPKSIPKTNFNDH